MIRNRSCGRRGQMVIMRLRERVGAGSLKNRPVNNFLSHRVYPLKSPPDNQLFCYYQIVREHDILQHC